MTKSESFLVSEDKKEAMLCGGGNEISKSDLTESTKILSAIPELAKASIGVEEEILTDIVLDDEPGSRGWINLLGVSWLRPGIYKRVLLKRLVKTGISDRFRLL